MCFIALQFYIELLYFAPGTEIMFYLYAVANSVRADSGDKEND